MLAWLLLTAALGLLTGLAGGFLVAVRLTPRLVARLDPKSRVAWARKVNALTR